MNILDVDDDLMALIMERADLRDQERFLVFGLVCWRWARLAYSLPYKRLDLRKGELGILFKNKISYDVDIFRKDRTDEEKAESLEAVRDSFESSTLVRRINRLLVEELYFEYLPSRLLPLFHELFPRVKRITVMDAFFSSSILPEASSPTSNSLPDFAAFSQLQILNLLECQVNAATLPGNSLTHLLIRLHHSNTIIGSEEAAQPLLDEICQCTNLKVLSIDVQIPLDSFTHLKFLVYRITNHDGLQWLERFKGEHLESLAVSFSISAPLFPSLAHFSKLTALDISLANVDIPPHSVSKLSLKSLRLISNSQFSLEPFGGQSELVSLEITCPSNRDQLTYRDFEIIERFYKLRKLKLRGNFIFRDIGILFPTLSRLTSLTLDLENSYKNLEPEEFDVLLAHLSPANLTTLEVIKFNPTIDHIKTISKLSNLKMLSLILGKECFPTDLWMDILTVLRQLKELTFIRLHGNDYGRRFSARSQTNFLSTQGNRLTIESLAAAVNKMKQLEALSVTNIFPSKTAEDFRRLLSEEHRSGLILSMF